MQRSTHFFRAILLALITVFLATAAHAQYRASIQGVVTDPQGEAVVGATVTLQNEETGQKTTTTSVEGGVFSFTGLPPSKFTIVVEKQGFKAKTIKGFGVLGEQANTVTVQMEVGQVTDSVTVNGNEEPLMDTESASLGGTVSATNIQKLPSIGRDPFALACVNMFGQAAPVVGVADPTSLFADKDPVLNRNKQATMHIVIDLLAYGHWNEADKWLTERYIQHNPGFASGRDTVMKAFGARGAGRPIPTDPKDWSTKIVAVTTQGNDVVCVASVSTRPDPRNPGQTYTTTHFDMWRFADGKADEHWDEGQISAAPAGGRGPGGPAPGARQ